MNNYYQVDRDVAIPSNGTCTYGLFALTHNSIANI